MAGLGAADGLADLRALEASWSRVRTGAALFSLAHFLSYRPRRDPPPVPMAAAGVAVGAALAGVNVVSRSARRTTDLASARRLGRLELAADSALATGVIWLYTFDEPSSAWALLFPPVLEAAVRDGLQGARRAWLGLSAAFLAREVWAARRYGRPLDPTALSYKLGIVLVAALTLGERVQELAKARVSLSELANSDDLTGLPNRRLLEDRLDHALTRRRSAGDGLALIVLDLDNLKAVNDSRGHAAGDSLLRSVSNRVRASVRPEDTVARIGGDEFVVLLEHASRDEALAVAERVRAAVAAAEASSSVGLAWVDDTNVVGLDLLQAADAAMYAAKRAGGNRVRGV
jgi:diguanylate cyclase (GGDEF)-like protein